VYGLTGEQVAALSTRRLVVLLGGLPGDARFPDLWRKTPRTVTDPAEIARLTGR
jgi:hypothetical protein